MSLTPPEMIIFDWDNTLVSNWETIVSALNGTFSHYGLPTITMAESRTKLQHSLREAFPNYFGDQAEQAKNLFYQKFEAEHLQSLTVLAGAEALLTYLSERKIPMAIVSNKTGKYLRAEIQALGWQEYFTHILGAQDCDRDKPDPLPVQTILSDHDLPQTKSIWFIGDAEVDMQCAQNCQIAGVYIGAQPSDNFDNIIDAKCSTLLDLRELITTARQIN